MTERIQDSPGRVFNVIGQNLVRDVKVNQMSKFKTRRKILTKTIGYWARKKEKDLQIGFKMSIPGIVGKMMTGEETDPFKPSVIKNSQMIQELIAEAINSINKE